MMRILFFVALVTLWAAVATASADEAFPRPAALEPDVQFWTRVYTEVGTDGGLLHDTRDLGVVYEVVRLPSEARSGRALERYVERQKQHTREILRRLAEGRRTDLSDEESRVLALFPPGVRNETLKEAAADVRFQLGQADKFRAGLIRSGAYVGHIRETLREMGLPEQIAALPHVESSFTAHAWSRVGAAGLWQFMPSTGRRYMRVDRVVDERLDPHVATIAAARLLENNYRVTGSWPLAITAYNHGAAGMRNAMRQLGTRDIATIVRQYRSRSFGFASRNFYVEFLAASAIAADPERHFGALALDAPIDFDRIEMPFHSSPTALARTLGVAVDVLRESNPALRPSVWQGSKHIPRGYGLNVPRHLLARPLEIALADVPEGEKYARQTLDSTHTVRRGETLSSIASHYGVRVSELVASNGGRDRIRVGQKLALPGAGAGREVVLAARDSATQPVSEPVVKESVNEPAVEIPTVATDGFYTVARGDSLWSISRRFGMSEADLVAANDLRNPRRLVAGQTLRVATSGANPPPSETVLAAAITPQVASAVAPQTASAVAPQMTAVAPPVAAAEPIQASPQPAASIPVALAAVEMPGRAEITAADASVAAEIVETAAEAGSGSEVSVATEAPSLLADPSDYTVASDTTVEVQATETLGHFAEWLDIRASRLRSINHLSFAENLVVNSRLKLDFSRVDPATFEQRRLAHHRAIQEAFFERYEIAGTETHRMRRGDSVWTLSQRKYNVPLWLLRQYNPDIDLGTLDTGAEITVPQLRLREIDAEGAALGEPARAASAG